MMCLAGVVAFSTSRVRQRSSSVFIMGVLRFLNSLAGFVLPFLTFFFCWWRLPCIRCHKQLMPCWVTVSGILKVRPLETAQ